MSRPGIMDFLRILHVWELKNGCRNENMKFLCCCGNSFPVKFKYFWTPIDFDDSCVAATPIFCKIQMLCNTYRIFHRQKNWKVIWSFVYAVLREWFAVLFGHGDPNLVDAWILRVWELENRCRNENLKFIFPLRNSNFRQNPNAFEHL